MENKRRTPLGIWNERESASLDELNKQSKENEQKKSELLQLRSQNKEKGNLHRRENAEAARESNKRHRLSHWLVLFSLCVIAGRLLFLGFYTGTNHFLLQDIARGAAVLLLPILLFLLVIRRFHSRTGWFILRIAAEGLAVTLICVFTMFMQGYFWLLLLPFFLGEGYLLIRYLSKKADSVRYNVYSPNGKRRTARLVADIAVNTLLLLAALWVSLSSVFLPSGVTDGLPGAGSHDSCIVGAPLNHTVRFSVDEDGIVKLDKTMLTLTDLFGWEILKSEKYEVPSTVTVNGEEHPVIRIGTDGFAGLRSVRAVYLPETVSEVSKSAFRGSTVAELYVSSSEIYFEDGLIGSSIKTLYINVPESADVQARVEKKAAKIILGEGASLKADLTVVVDKELIDEYRMANPDFARQIVPAVKEGEAFVNFDVCVPEGITAIGEYIPTQILTVGSEGATVKLPYSDLVVESEYYGGHPAYTEDGRIFRLLDVFVNGERADVSLGAVQIESNTKIELIWTEMYTVRADYSALGDGFVTLAELRPDMSDYILPTGVSHELMPGYTCNGWTLDGKPVKRLTRLNRSYVLTPVWSLDAPSLTVSGSLEFVYDGEQHEISMSATHIADGVTFSYRWQNGSGDDISHNEYVGFTNVSESGSYTAIATATDADGNLAEARVNVSVSVIAKPLTVVADGKTVTYGYDSAELTYTADGLIGNDKMQGGLIREPGENAGEYDILLGTLTAGNNYKISYTGAVYTIEKADYDMSGVSLSDNSFVYDGESHTLKIDGELPRGLDGIGVTVSYEGSVKNVFDGEVAVRAIFATESENYNIPDAMFAFVCVTPRPVTVIAEDVSTVYGVDKPLTFVLSNPVENDEGFFTGTLVREEGDTVGDYAITEGTLALNENYAVDGFTPAVYTIEKADYDMSGVSLLDKSFVYDGESHTLKIDGELPVGLDGIGVTVSYEGSVKDVLDGEVTVTATFATDSENYNPPTPLTAKVRITKRPVTVSAEDKTVTYGESAVPLSYISDGLVGADEITGSLEREAGDSVGEYAILIGTVAVGDNYEIIYTGALYTIEKANYDMSGVSLSDKSFVYDGESHTLKIDGELPRGLDGIGVTVSYTGSAINVTDGEVTVTATFATDSENYNPPAPLTATVKITPKPISVTANATGSVYGHPDAELTYTGELLGNDSFSGTLKRETGSNAGEYDILIGTLTAGANYEISFKGAAYTIEKADYDMSGIRFDSEERVYDKSYHYIGIKGELPAGLDGIKLTVTYEGNGKARNVSDGAVEVIATFATESENYNTPAPMKATVTVTPKLLKITAFAREQVYGEGFIGLDYTSEGLVDGDSISGSLYCDAGDDVGTYPIGIGTLTAGANYEISYTGGDYVVKKANYDMSGVSLSDKSFVYDGESHTLKIDGELPRGLDGIGVTVSYTGSAINVTDGEVTVTATFATESENYNTPAPLVAKVSITKRPLTVNAEGKTVTYGESAVPLTYSSGGLVGADEITGSLEREPGENAGEYAILIGTLSAGDNYEILYTGATYRILRAKSVINTEGVALDYVYTGEEQTVNSGAGLNHGEAELIYENNSFTTVAEGNGLQIRISVPQTENYLAAEVTLTLRVEKRTVEVPQELFAVYYTGELYTPLSDTDDYFVSGDTSESEIGKYSIQVTLRDSENLSWSDPEFDGSLEWEIVSMPSGGDDLGGGTDPYEPPTP